MAKSKAVAQQMGNCHVPNLVQAFSRIENVALNLVL